MPGDPGYREMVDHLAEIAPTIRKPSAIVVISANWEETVVLSSAHRLNKMHARDN